MTKSRSKKGVQRHTRYFIELSTQRKFLILKRGRLTRTGEAISVSKLDSGSVDAKSWLQANLPKVNDSTLHPWDAAHQLANKVLQDLGEFPYVEPEINSGQVGVFRDVMKERAAKPKNDDEEVESKDGADLNDLDPRALVPDPMREVNKLLPNFDFGIPASMNDFGIPKTGIPGEDFGHGQSKPPHSKMQPKGSNQDATKPRRFVFPLIRTMPGWADLNENCRKMLEVEMVQVYRGAKLRAKYPLLERTEVESLSTDEIAQIFDELRQMPMSKKLRDFLSKTPDFLDRS